MGTSMAGIFETCMEQYGPMLLLAKWGPFILIGLGLIFLTTAIYAYLKLEKSLVSSLILLVLGLGFVTFPFTGSVPAIGGQIDKMEVKNTSMFDLYGKIYNNCRELENNGKTPDDPDPAAQPPKVQETFDKQTEIDSDGLPNLDKYSEIPNVWLFYRPQREGDASVVESLLTVSGIVTFGAKDDLSGVSRQKPYGSARIIFTDMVYYEFAFDLAKSIELEVPGEVYLEGPFPNIRSGPVQVQLF